MNPDPHIQDPKPEEEDMSKKKRIMDIVVESTPIYLEEDSGFNDVLRLFSQNDGINVIPVLNNQSHPIGVVSKDKVFEALLQEYDPDTSIKEVTEKDFEVVSEDVPLEDILRGQSDNCSPFVVVDGAGRFSGIIPLDRLFKSCRSELRSIQDKYDELSRSFDEKLEESKHTFSLFENILDNAYEGIVVTDEKGVIRYCNPQHLSCIRREKDEVINRHLSLISPESRLFKVLESGEPDIGVPFRNDDGREMIVNRVPIKEDGRMIGVMGVILFKDLTDLKHLMQRLNVLETTVAHYKNELQNVWSSRYTIENIIGNSKAIEDVRRLALKAAKVTSPILILGESGTGKELFAHAIHYASPRRNKPMIRLDCSAIPRDLLESELFGYESGAFTGAGKRAKPGKFELADKGTIFLDEIADMPLEMQAKLLRVLQEKEITRIGGTKPIKVDFRLISATHHNLDDLVKANSFRTDLYYRLNVIRLAIPPLRERKEDILQLSNHILRKIGDQNGKGDIHLSKGVIELLQEYHWPGNVRELGNILERTANFVEEKTIDIEDLPSFFRTSLKTTHDPPPLKRCVRDVEIALLVRTIKSVNGNKAKAARILGIHRTALYKKLKRFDINTSQWS